MPPPPGRVLARAAAPSVDLGSFGVRFLLAARHTGGAFSLVEHPVPPRTLAAPLHRHSREDEYSVVLEGTLTVQLGDEVHEAHPGDVVCKPRGEWHTFWNAADVPCRFLELITPPGLEQLFEDLAADPAAMTGERAAATDAAYGLEVDYDSIGRLCAAHGVTFPG
jgi:quercetin dioxygenase-like cupin family protein